MTLVTSDGKKVSTSSAALKHAGQGWGLALSGQPGSVVELRFNPAEPRDSRGRWTRFGATGSAAGVMMKNREGFSVSVKTGGEPASGYMVAQTDHTHTFSEDILDDHARLTRAIDDMLMSEKSAFQGKNDVYLGGWVHDGKLWLEPSDNIASREQAVREGARRNQIAIWDVGNGQEIQTGGSGGGRITEHANPQGDHRAGPGGLLGPARGSAAGGSSRAGQRYPGTITAQLELAAWQHELRDPEGRWTDAGALSGTMLWNSSEGRIPDPGPEDIKHAKAAWYGYNFRKTERYLRAGHDQPDPDIEAFISMIRRAPPLTRPAVLYRGVGDPDAIFGPPGSRVGHDYTDTGLVSSTTDGETARRYSKGTGALITIHVPSGTHVLHADPRFAPDEFTYNKHKEFTLPPGVKYRVLSDQMQDGQREIELGVLP